MNHYAALFVVALCVGCGPDAPRPQSECVDRMFSSTDFDTHCYRAEQRLEQLAEKGANGAAMFMCRCPRPMPAASVAK